MGTANFRNHENGIFVIEEMSYEDTVKYLLEDGDYTEEDITDEMVYSEINFQFEHMIEIFLEDCLYYNLKEKGIELDVESETKAKAYRNGRLIAELTIESGYYAHAQLIVETDPEIICPYYEDYFFNDRTGDYQDKIVKSKLYEDYTPHNKTLFKVVEKCTTPIRMVGRFSNGEAVYERK